MGVGPLLSSGITYIHSLPLCMPFPFMSTLGASMHASISHSNYAQSNEITLKKSLAHTQGEGIIGVGTGRAP